jgi:hypothetical protein
LSEHAVTRMLRFMTERLREVLAKAAKDEMLEDQESI